MVPRPKRPDLTSRMAFSEPAGAHPTPASSIAANRIARGLDTLSASHARALAVLLVLSLLAFLPGFFFIPPIDRDEARFAQATKQMLETGNFVDIRFQDQARHKKPVGIYWLQAASVATAQAFVGPSARTTIAFYRLPSLLGAIGAVLLTYGIGVSFLSRRGALLAGAIMATCVLLGVEARLAKTDAMLLATILAALLAFTKIYFRPRTLPEGQEARASSPWRLPALFWTALAAGILIKGPMAPLFVGLPVITLALADRSLDALRLLKPLPGLIWCLILCLPWFVAIYIVTDGAFYQHAVGVDMLGKVAEGAEGHWGPPGTYLLAIWGTFWPGVVLVAMAVPFAWRQRRAREVRFLLAWIVPAWIILELTATKLPHYVLPLYPALALLAALALEKGALDTVGRRLSGLRVLWPGLAGVLILAGAGGYFWFGGRFVWWLAALPVLLASLVLLAGASAGWSFRGARASFVAAACGALLLYAAVYQLLLPHMHGLWISKQMAAIARASGCPANHIVSVPYQEPSLAFLIGTQIQFKDPAQAADLLKAQPCSLAFIGSGMLALFSDRAAHVGLVYDNLGTVEGFTYNGGRRVLIHVFRPREGAR